MLIWCGRSARELGDERPGVVVLPEGVSRINIRRAAGVAPDAIIAAAILSGGRMKGVLRHRGRNRIRYLKVLPDQWTAGGSLPAHWPVYETEDLAIGLVICVDLQCPELMDGVIQGLQAAKAPRKVLCVVTNTYAGNLLSADPVGYPSWAGIHVALSNSHAGYPDNRLQNFVTDEIGWKVAKQEGAQPVRHWVA